MRLLLILALIAHCSVKAQEGTYDGVINVNGVKLEIVLKLENESEWTGSMDIPMQQAKDLQLTKINITNDSVSFHMPDVPGTADAKCRYTADSLVGDFIQMGMTFKLTAALRNDSEEISQKILELEPLIDSLRRELKVPGLGIAVIYKNEIRLNTGFGYADIESERPVDENTRFAIGSTSKAFTAAMVLETLKDKGIGKLDPIAPYIPGFSMKDPFAASSINAEDLLTHRSGLPRHDMLWYGSELTRQELIGKIRYLEPTEPFRTRFQYQNLMFLAAGYFVGQQYESTWEAELKRMLLDPLGMEQTTPFCDKLKEGENSALPYGEELGEIKKIGYRSTQAIGPAGSIISTSNDMIKWVKMLLNAGKFEENQVLYDGATRELFAPRMPMSVSRSRKEITEMHYGLGWMTYYYQGKKIVQHGGNIDGYSALVYLMPDEELGLVILTNKNGTGLPDLLALYITDKLLGLEHKDWYSVMYPSGYKSIPEDDVRAEKDNPVPASFAASELVGKYEHDIYGQIKVSLEDDELYAQYNVFKYKLSHYNRDVYKGESEEGGLNEKFLFRSDKSGDIAYLDFSIEASLSDYSFKRIPDFCTTCRDYLEPFTGNYKMDDQTVKITLTDNKLYLKVSGQSFQLNAVSKDKFSLGELEGYFIKFEKDKKGNVTGLISMQPNGDFRAKKS